MVICVPADNTLILLELHFQLVLNFFSQQKHCTFGKEDRRIPQAEIGTQRHTEAYQLLFTLGV